MITLNDAPRTEKAITTIHALYPTLPIEARARDFAQSEKLSRLGATGTVPETLEAALQLGRAVLFHAGVADDQVQDVVENLRRDDYALLRRVMGEHA